MKQDQTNKWYWHTNGQCLINSLYQFQVKIQQVKIIDDMTHYQLLISTNKGKKELVFHFKSLEEAINFTEDSVAYATDTDEITESYLELLKPKVKKK